MTAVAHEWAYVVLDGSGLVLAASDDWSEARAACDARIPESGAVWLIRQSDGAVCAIGTRQEGAERMKLFAAAERINSKVAPLARSKERHRASCACGTMAWETQPDGGLRCSECGTFAWVNGGGCRGRVQPYVCCVCGDVATRRRWRGHSRHDHYCGRCEQDDR